MAFGAFLSLATGGRLLNILPPSLVVCWPLAVAYYLLRGAPLIMRLAYPTPRGDRKEGIEEMLPRKAEA